MFSNHFFIHLVFYWWCVLQATRVLFLHCYKCSQGIYNRIYLTNLLITKRSRLKCEEGEGSMNVVYYAFFTTVSAWRFALACADDNACLGAADRSAHNLTFVNGTSDIQGNNIRTVIQRHLSFLPLISFKSECYALNILPLSIYFSPF